MPICCGKEIENNYCSICGKPRSKEVIPLTELRKHIVSQIKRVAKEVEAIKGWLNKIETEDHARIKRIERTLASKRTTLKKWESWLVALDLVIEKGVKNEKD